MPNYLDPRGFQRVFIPVTGGTGTAREGGLTQTGAGGDTVSFQRAPSYRQTEIADPKAVTADNSKTLLYVGGALALAFYVASKR